MRAARGAGDLEDRLAHQADRVHVHAGLGRGDVDRRADPLRLRQHRGQRLDEQAFTGGHALLHQRGEAADQVHACVGGRGVEFRGQGQGIRRGVPLQQDARRRDGQPLVHDRQPVLRGQPVADLDQVAGAQADFGAGGLHDLLHVAAGAVVEVDAQRHRADVQVLLLEHADRRKDVTFPGHVSCSRAGP
ncbi:MAG: hypothetical protein BWY87_01034 [Deltaproteobacteria bacterium ADurb.Bin510]|nr:MAG: hypothetical protein BWY87_01034 [Deltaproteobacteria bacterium ADurb.Bin510]